MRETRQEEGGQLRARRHSVGILELRPDAAFYRRGSARAIKRLNAWRWARSASSISTSISARATLTSLLSGLVLALITTAIDDPILSATFVSWRERCSSRYDFFTSAAALALVN